jgi:hypothetical protein
MNEKFKRAVIFSGGGTRLMIYLGIFAALDELNLNLIFSSLPAADHLLQP